VHRNLRLKITDGSGHTATLSITGPGLGTITQDNGNLDLVVTGTTKVSTLTVAGKTSFALNNVDIHGALNSFNGRTVNLVGNMNAGGIRQLTLASAAGTSATTIKLGGAIPVILAIGGVANVTLTAGGGVTSINAVSWAGGAIDAPSIGSLIVRGSFSADVRTHAGGKLQSARLGSVTGGTWAIAGGNRNVAD